MKEVKEGTPPQKNKGTFPKAITTTVKDALMHMIFLDLLKFSVQK